MSFASIFAALVVVLNGGKAPYTALCLVEIAAMSGDRLDLTDPSMRQAVTRKADALMALAAERSSAYGEFLTAQERRLAQVPASELSGDLPPGSYAVIRRQMLEDRDRMRADRLREIAPSCDWPDLPVERPLPQY